MKQNTKDWIQYSTAVAMIVSAIVIAFLAFFFTADIASGVLIYIAQALFYAVRIFGVSIYFITNFCEFESKLKDEIKNMMKDK